MEDGKWSRGRENGKYHRGSLFLNNDESRNSVCLKQIEPKVEASLY